MPGKVNPVMSEMLVQVCLYAQGLAQTVMACGREGQCELNATLPLTVHCLREAVHCLASGVDLAGAAILSRASRPMPGAAASWWMRSLMLVTALNPHLGYDVAAAVAKEALLTGRSLREVVLEKEGCAPKVRQWPPALIRSPSRRRREEWPQLQRQRPTRVSG